MKFFGANAPRFVIVPILAVAVLGGAAAALLGLCGSFTDVTDATFCPFVLEIFTLGITSGTTPTTYAPSDNVTRLQMAAFLSRTVDRTLQRANRRAALKQFWTPRNSLALGTISIGGPNFIESDGTDVWVASGTGVGDILRVRGSDGRILETWTGATSTNGLLVAIGRIFAAGNGGKLYKIDPNEPAGVVTTVATNLGTGANGITFDGSRIWTANTSGSVSIVTPGVSPPWTVTTVTSGFTVPAGALYDGANVWVTDTSAGTILKLDGNGVILQTVTVGTNPEIAAFDGTNIWVPNFTSATVSVVRASSGAVLATLTGNGLNGPFAFAFDGARALVTDFNGNAVSFWKAADLTPLGTISTGVANGPFGVCSDGVSFWIGLQTTSQLARF